MFKLGAEEQGSLIIGGQRVYFWQALTELSSHILAWLAGTNAM